MIISKNCFKKNIADIFSFILFVATISILFFNCTASKANKDNHIFAIVGTYSDSESNQGIYVYDFNQADGSLQEITNTDSVYNPSYIALTNDEKYLYAVNENTDTTEKGMVSAFSFNNKTGAINFLNKVPSNGDAPCFVVVDKDGRNVSVANYNGGNFSVYKTDSSGKLLPACQIVAHSGTSANKKIQTQSHVHSTFFSPDEKYLFVCDLGNDTLYQYPFDATAAKPVDELHVRTYKVPAGFGPRHLVFSPDEKFMYLLNELDAQIIVYKYSSDSLTYMQTIISTNLTDTVTGDKGSAAIRISPDGKFLYASNRGNANDIAIFKINADGTFKYLDRMPTDKHPRDFNISPNGKYLFIASRDNNNIKVYAIDKQTGQLHYTDHYINVSKPVAIIFGGKN